MIWSLTNWRSSGSLLLRYTSTVGEPTPVVTRLRISVTMSAGTTTAATASPFLTASIASCVEFTLTRSIDWNKGPWRSEMLTFCWPNASLPLPGWTSL